MRKEDTSKLAVSLCNCFAETPQTLHFAAQCTVFRIMLPAHCTVFRIMLTAHCTVFRIMLPAHCTVFHIMLTAHCTVFRIMLTAQCTVFRIMLTINTGFSRCVQLTNSLLFVPQTEFVLYELQIVYEYITIIRAKRKAV